VVLEELIEKNNLIGLLVKNIQSFREGIGAMLPPKEKYPPEFVKGYIGTLSERVQTLKQLVKMNDKKDMLSLELLNTLWREFVL
jgi:hypothetical protein